MADIDNLSFSVILKDEDFKKKLTALETRAKQFNAIMEKAMRVQAQAAAADASAASATERKAAAEAKATKYVRESLLQKERAGTITDKELQVLNKVRTIQKSLVGVEKQRLSQQARGLITAMQSSQFTENQLKSLASLLALEKSRLSHEDKQAAAQERSAKAAERAAASERQKQTAAERTTTAYVKQSAVMSQLKTLVGTYISVLGGVRLIGSLVRITGEFEAQHAALGAILGDIKEADLLFDKLKVLAVKSPFTFMQLTSYAKQLSAFSEPTEQLYETTKKLSDVSAGLGVDMSRIVLAWGQVRSAAYLRGQELRQFTEAGIPMLQMLAEQLGEIEGRVVSTGEVFEKISSRQVPFEMVAEAFERMTSAGGKFYNMQEVLAGTIKGKVANLVDSWQIMLSTIGDSNRGLIGGVIDALRILMANADKLVSILKSAAVAWAVFKVATIAANNATKLSVSTLRKLATVLNFFKMTNPWILALSAAAGIVAGLVTHFSRLNKEANKYKEIVSDTAASSSAQLDVMEAYLHILQRTTVGTEEYERTRKALVKYAGNYLTALDKEKLAVGDLAGVYENLKAAVEQAARARGMEQAYSEIDATATERLDKIYSKMGMVSQAFLLKFKAYVQGTLSMDDLISSLSMEESMKAISKVSGPISTSYILNLNELKNILSADAARIRKIKQEVMEKRNEVMQAFNELYGEGEDDKLAQIVAKVTKEQWDSDFLPKPNELFGEWKMRMQEYSEAAQSMVIEFSHMPQSSEKMADVLAQRREKGEIAELLLAMFGLGEDAGLNAEQKMINDYIKNKAASYGNILVNSLKVTSSTTMKDWRAQAKEMYEESKDTLANITKVMAQQAGETIEQWRKRMDGNVYAVAEGRIRFLDDLSKALFGGNGFNDLLTVPSHVKTAINNEVSSIKQLVENAKMLKRYYDELAELGFNDKEIRFFFDSMGLSLPAEGLNETLDNLAAKLKALGDDNGAQDVLNYLSGKDMDASLEALKRSRKAMASWGEQVEKLQAQTKRLGLDGFSLELDKILVDADSKNRQLLLDWSQKAKELESAKDGWIAEYRIKNETATIEEASRAWEEYYAEQTAAAKASIDEQIAYTNKVAQQQINGKASGWVSEMLNNKGIDLGNIDAKSLSQLERYLSEMESLASGEALAELIPDQLKADAEAVNVTFSTLLNTIREIIGNKQLDVKADIFKKKFDAIAQSLKSVGVDVDFSSVTEQLNRYTEAMEKYGEASDAAKKARGGLLVAGVGSIIGGVASALTKAAGGMREWAEATNDAQLKAQAENLAFAASAAQGVADGIFAAVKVGGSLGKVLGVGTALISVASAVFNRIVAIRKVNYSIALSTKQLVEDYRQLNYELKEFNETFGDFPLAKATDAMTKFSLASADLKEKLSLLNVTIDRLVFAKLSGVLSAEQIRQLEKTVNALDMLQVQIGNNQYQTLFDFLKENNMDIYGENGILDTSDIDRVKVVLDNLGDRLSDDGKRFMESILNTLTAMKEAEDELDSVLTEYLGDLSETMVDALWTEFAEGGDSAWEAWTDAGNEAIGEVAKAMLRAQIQQAWLNKYLKPLETAFAGQDINQIASLIQEMTNDIDSYKEGRSWLNELNAQLLKQGIDIFSNSSSSDGTLSGGIKSITEDTANLLASYLNGIRADVSYGRVLWERMAVALEGMGSQKNTPSLAEYLPRLESHAANIATSNQQLLISLQSVITREGGLPAIRSCR